MVLTMSLVLMSSILVGIYLAIKDRKNAFTCLLGACLFLLLALFNIAGGLEVNTFNMYQVNEQGEIVLF